MRHSCTSTQVSTLLTSLTKFGHMSNRGIHLIKSGNRLVTDIIHAYREIITKSDALEHIEQPGVSENEHYYTTSDYSTETTKQLYENFDDGLADGSLAEQDERPAEMPLVTNPVVESR